jgi:hypothetical protein
MTLVLALAGLASAAEISVVLETPVVLWLDGAMLDTPETGNTLPVPLSPGRRTLEARTARGRPLARVVLDVGPQGHGRIVYRDRAFRAESLHDVQWTPAAAVVAEPAAVTVDILAQDGAWANVYVDGALAGELRNTPRALTLHLRPGPHRVEIRDFLDTATIVRGILTVPAATRTEGVRLAFTRDRPAEVYGDDGGWAPER